MKRLRRLFILLAGLWAFVALASLYSVYLSRQTPAWYHADKLTAAQQATAANESDQKLADLLSYASDLAAYQHRRLAAERLAKSSSPDAAPPPRPDANVADLAGEFNEPKTITITETQANAFFDKWRISFGDRLSNYVSDSRLVLLDHRLLLAGTLKNVGLMSNTVASLEFDSTMDADGRIRPRLSRVFSGRLPVPLALLGNPLRKISQRLSEDLPRWQQQSNLSGDGIGNQSAAEAVLAKLVLASLNGQSTNSIFLLPCDATNFRRVVPVRIGDMKVSDRLLTLTIRPLTDSELKSLLNEIRDPFQATAGAN